MTNSTLLLAVRGNMGDSLLEASEEEKRHWAILSAMSRIQKAVVILVWLVLVAFAAWLALWAFGEPLQSSIASIGAPNIETIRAHTIELSGKDKPKPEFETVINITPLDKVDGTAYFVGYAVRADAAPLKILMYDSSTSYGYRAWPY